MAIDEVESGLDPHRLSNLVRYLRDRTEKDELQVLLRTHSALVVESLTHDQLFVVRSKAGTTTVTGVPSALAPAAANVLQGVMRERPSALLAQRVIVGEGATEVGFFRQLLHQWDEQATGITGLTSVTAGAALANGSGDSHAPRRSAALAHLGYPTLLVIDGDVTTNDALIAEAKAAGVEVVQWPLGCALEDVLMADFDVAGLHAVLELAVDEKSKESVVGSVGAHLGQSIGDLDVAGLFATFGEAKVRNASARAAKGAKINGDKQDGKAWFKREDRGEQLGAVVWNHSSGLRGDVLTVGVQRVKEFVYGLEIVEPVILAEGE